MKNCIKLNLLYFKNIIISIFEQKMFTFLACLMCMFRKKKVPAPPTPKEIALQNFQADRREQYKKQLYDEKVYERTLRIGRPILGKPSHECTYFGVLYSYTITLDEVLERGEYATYEEFEIDHRNSIGNSDFYSSRLNRVDEMVAEYEADFKKVCYEAAY